MKTIFDSIKAFLTDPLGQNAPEHADILYLNGVCQRLSESTGTQYRCQPKQHSNLKHQYEIVKV